MKPARIKAYIALATTFLIWGAAQPLIKPALQYVFSVQYMFLRYLVSLPLAIITFIPLYRKYHPSWKQLLLVTGIEMVGLANLIVLYTGLSHTTALQASLIINTRPIFYTLMGIWLLKEREQFNEWLGLLLSVLGTTMVILSPYIYGHTYSFTMQLGNTIILFTNIISTFGTYLNKKYYKKLSKPLVGSFNILIGIVFFTVYNLISYHSLPITALSHTQVLFPVLYMAILGTMLANTLEIYGFISIEASEAALFYYLEPLIYIPLSVFWLKEPLLPLQVLGLIAIILGVGVAAARFPSHKRRLITHGIPLLRSIQTAEEPVPLKAHFQQ